MANKYYIANSSQENFITADEKVRGLVITVYPGDVYVVEDNAVGIAWAKRVNATEKSKTDSQTLVNSAVATLQSDYDAKDDIYKGYPISRPTDITLP